MSFGLKNVGATYQRLVNMMFFDLIDKIMEVYVDNMLVKSFKAVDLVSYLENTFIILKKLRMKLNPLECTVGMASGQFFLLQYQSEGNWGKPLEDQGPNWDEVTSET